MSDRDFRIPLRPSRSGNERAPQGTDGAEGRDRSPIGRLSGGRDPGTSSTVRFGVRPDRHNTPASGNSSGIGRGPPPAFGPVAHQSGLVASQGMPPHQQRPLAPSFQRGLDRAPTSSFGHSVRQPGHPGMPRQQVPANGGGHSAIRHPQAGQPPVQGRFCSQNASQPFQGRERTSHCAQPAADQRSMPSSFSSGRGHPSAQPAADQRSMPSSFSSGRGHPSTHSGPRNDQFRDSRSFGSDRGSSDRDQERSRSNYRSSNDGSRGRCFSQESAASGQSTERQFDRGGRGGWMGGRGSSSGGRGSWDGGRGGGRGRGSYGGGRGGGNFGPFSDQPVKDLCDLAPLEFDPNSSSGTVGTEIKIRSNFVACDVTKSWKIFMYHVTFDPMIESRRMKFGLMRSQKDVHGGTFVPDSTLYSSKEFTREGEEKTLIALLRPPRGCPDDASSPREVKITYRRVKTIDSHDEQAVTILTNLVKQSQRLLNLTQIRRHFLDLKALKHVPQHCLSLAPSYDVHLTARDAGLLMCVNVRSRPLRSDTVLDHLRRLYNEAKGDWSVYKKLSMESLLGQVVFTTYRHDTYEIGGIDWDKSVSSPFKEGSDKTVLDYFKEKYSEDPSAHIRDFNQPLLLAVPTAKSRRRAKVAEAQGVEAAPAQHQLHLVPELCRMTGLGASARQNRPLMEDLARIMRKDPNTRVADGRGFVSRFNGNPEVLRLCREDYNLEMARDLIEVKARHLGEPSLSIKDRRLHMHNATFNNCLKNNRAERPTDLLKWAVICPEKDFSITQTAVREIVQIGNELGMRIEEPARYEKVGDVRMVAYNEAIRNVVGHEYSAILAVVPDDDSTRYSGIKKKLMIDNAIPNQVAKVTTLRKGNKSISTKIAAQLLCKLGGAPWAVPTSTDGTLLIGFDLWREKKSRPVSAMVACLDQNNTKFFSRSFIENSPQGVSHHFEEGFSDCLRAYVKLNKRQPKRVVIFRSGASFGENDHIKEVEVNGVKRRYKEFLSADVKLGFVLVNRRTSVMFYAEQGSGKFGNVPAGTVIDSGVTEPGVKDFFLVPLSSGQGTVNPTYYRILEDSIPEFGMDTYQLMAFKQSHGYFNWTGAIRVPAVVQYATKLASLVGTHTMEPLHKELSDVLSFL